MELGDLHFVRASGIRRACCPSIRPAPALRQARAAAAGPPAWRFVDDMRSFHAEPNGIKADEIATASGMH
jgi:hypothetical protein